MSCFLDIALPLAERGFRVFPLIPKLKQPVKMSWGDHFDAATTEKEDLELWNKEVPNANVGISPDENFCFLETDDEAALRAECSEIPPQAWDTARVSARVNRCYYIFRQTMRTRKTGNMTATRENQDNLFEFKQHRVYVTGPGSIHPKTNAPYAVEWRTTIPAMPDVLLNRLCELYGAPKATDTQPMSDAIKSELDKLDRFLAYYEVASNGDWFSKGKSWYRPVECPWLNEHENDNQGTSTCLVFTEGEGYGFNCKHRCAGKGWKEFKAELEARFPNKPKFRFLETEQAPTVTIGPVPVTDAELAEAMAVDWREHYHTVEEFENAPPASFLIEGFLQLDGITALAAPVGQRKSLIALNVAHALCTGEPLFDNFKVSNPPTRVLYLCPEMGIRSFADRLKKIELLPYVGKTLFVRTMSAEGKLELDELTPDELKGAAVIIDTAVRYLKGDENSSEHMRVFAEDIFRIMRDGAVSVLLLHHSAKGTKESAELSLENAMRGSGELGAFVSSCWATRLQDPGNPYESASFVVNVKQRDFESNAFEITSGRDCRLHMVDNPGKATLATNKPGAKADKDGREADALKVIMENPDTSVRGILLLLKDLGIKRSKTWVGDKRYELLQRGVTTAA
jgi:hypothetical protein